MTDKSREEEKIRKQDCFVFCSRYEIRHFTRKKLPFVRLRFISFEFGVSFILANTLVS